jgi:hypothetical protein
MPDVIRHLTNITHVMLNLIQHLKPPALPEQDSGIRRNDVWEQK